MPIFDQGYQHWQGELSGHSWRWLAITRHGVRIGKTNRMLRLLLLVAFLPAIVMAAVLCLWGILEQGSALSDAIKPLLAFLGSDVLAEPLEYRHVVWTLCYSHFLSAELTFSMLLILIVGPNLISQDLRYNALPLYFSRPLRRIDYFGGKLGVIAVFLAMVIIVPSVIAYVLGLLFSLDITIVRDTYDILLAAIGYGLLIAVSAGLLMLALSALSRNSRYVALMWLCIWLVGTIMASVLEQVNDAQQRHVALRTGDSMAGDAYMANVLEAKKRDWRPLVSYRANLSRVGEYMLGTSACWERLSELQPQSQRSSFLVRFMGPQYPWYWSAIMLAGLGGLSICILILTIRSLDRLR